MYTISSFKYNMNVLVNILKNPFDNEIQTYFSNYLDI
jgi:hypothetical protein